MFKQTISVSPYNFIEAIEEKREIPEKVVIYDSTLRDGEQMAGVAFTFDQKLEIARKLDEVGVKQIEAGFPAVSVEEKKAVKAVSNEDLNAEILALSRLRRNDIDCLIDCDVDMALLFIASSELHLKYKLRISRDEVLQKVGDSMQYALDHGIRASFSTEDSTRTDISFLNELNAEAEKYKTERIGITDTVGCISPEGIAYLVSEVKNNIDTPLSVHLHNDFGLALANALVSVQHGACAVATTVSGMGERAGNVPLEQFVMAMKVVYNKDLDIDTSKLKELSDLVSKCSGVQLPKNLPFVGDNAFAHESGIHVAATLYCPMTYESIPPELVGNSRRLVFGKHSGKAAVKDRLEEKGINATENEVCNILKKIKMVGEKKGRVSTEEFWRIVEEELKR